MKRKFLKNGFSLPVLGLGTWGHGGRTEHNPENDDAGQIHALQSGIDQGFSLIDTAEYYADGYAETLIGRAVAGYPREQLQIISKVWKTHLSYDGVLRAAEGSLRRLNTSYLDVYLIHQLPDTDDFSLAETFSALNRLYSEGLVKHLGVSNFALPRLKRAMALSESPIVLNQVHYNLRVREAEGELLEFCRENDVFLQAYRPLRNVSPCALTEELCAKYRICFAQLALSYLLSKDHVTAITAIRSVAHLPENLAAADIVLSVEDVRRLDCEYPGTIAVSDVVPLR